MRHVRIDPAEGATTEDPAGAAGVSVRERMSRPAVTVTADAPLDQALRLMTANRIHYLPVVNGEARLLGIVNADDVLQTRRALRPPAVVVGP
jgi:CBS domain-containing protein